MSRSVATLVILAVAGVLYAAFRWFGNTSLVYEVYRAVGLPGLITEGLFKVALWMGACALTLRASGAKTYGDVGRQLGLWSGAVDGTRLAALASVPTAIVMTWFADATIDGVEIVATAVLSPVAEEVLFRGWIFRQLIQRAGWPVVPAAVVSAVAFGLAHPGYVSSPVAVLSAAGAGLLFSWLTLRWDSLWPAIGVHAALNLSWAILGSGSVDLTPGGRIVDLTAIDLARAVAIAIAVIWTLLLRPASPKSKGPAKVAEPFVCPNPEP